MHSPIIPIGILASKPVLEGEIRLMVDETQASFASEMTVQEIRDICEINGVWVGTKMWRYAPRSAEPQLIASQRAVPLRGGKRDTIVVEDASAVV